MQKGLAALQKENADKICETQTSSRIATQASREDYFFKIYRNAAIRQWYPCIYTCFSGLVKHAEHCEEIRFWGRDFLPSLTISVWAVKLKAQETDCLWKPTEGWVELDDSIDPFQPRPFSGSGELLSNTQQQDYCPDKCFCSPALPSPQLQAHDFLQFPQKTPCGSAGVSRICAVVLHALENLNQCLH